MILLTGALIVITVQCTFRSLSRLIYLPILNAIFGEGAYLKNGSQRGALIRKEALIERRALNRIIKVRTGIAMHFFNASLNNVVHPAISLSWYLPAFLLPSQAA